MDHELGTGQFVDKGDFRTLEEGNGHLIHQGRLAVTLHAQIVGLSLLNQIHQILKARTAPALDGDAQHQGLALGLRQRGQPTCGSLGQGDAFRRARGDGKGGCGLFCGLDGAHALIYEAVAGI